MKIVLYEDDKYINFHPLIHFRPLFCLVFGARKIWEKIFDLFSPLNSSSISFYSREPQLDCFLNETSFAKFERYDKQDTLFINARLKDVNQLLLLDKNQYLLDQNNEIAAFRIANQDQFEIIPDAIASHAVDEKIVKFLDKRDNCFTIEYVFDFITLNRQEMINDFIRMKQKKDIVIHKNSKIDKLVKLDASNGPIFIGNNTRISAFTEIRGPSYIAENAILDRAFLHDAVYIGNACRISGEIDSSIIMDYTNKHHTGFFGHSYIGQWVNIGAMSTTSDLKNNYSPIRFELNSDIVDTRTNKMGSLIGDHVKIAIGIMINCGTIIGEGSVIFEPIHVKTVNSLSWGNKGVYKENEFIKNCIKIMKRRNIEVSEYYRKLLFSLSPNK